MQHLTSDSPVIGISGTAADSRSVQAMMACVHEAGAVPIILANHSKRKADSDISKLDAVIIMGNDYDVDPELYIHRYLEGDVRRAVHPKTKSVAQSESASARAAYERELIALALESKIPLFTICGGMQTVNVLCGGTLHQHIPDLLGHDRHATNAGADASRAVISVSIVPDSLLDNIIKNRTLTATGMPPLISDSGTVNAFHHQSVDRLGSGLIASAHSDAYTALNGDELHLIEAIEADPAGKYKDQFLLGVQWHPEFLPEATDKIVRDMQQAARAFAKAQSRTHPPEEAKMENILSAVPILKGISDFAKDRVQPSSHEKPKGRGR